MLRCTDDAKAPTVTELKVLPQCQTVYHSTGQFLGESHTVYRAAYLRVGMHAILHSNAWVVI